jgi:hypothetical protein
MTPTTLRVILVFACIFSSSCSYPDTTQVQYDAEKSIRYPGSYDLHIYNSKPYTWEIDYKVHLSYPSESVLVFYNDRLSVLGWVPDKEQGYRAWHSFGDNPRIHQLLAKWKKGDMMILLAIRYYSSNFTNTTTPDNDVQNVITVIMPFSSLPPN